MASQIVKVAMFQPAVQNVDEIQLKTFSNRIVDGYIDEAGFINKRPGTTLFAGVLDNTITDDASSVLLDDQGGQIFDNDGVSAECDGLFWWDDQDLIIAVSNGNVFKMDVNGVTTLLGSGLETGTKVSFAAGLTSGTTDTLFMANGGSIYYTTGSTLTVMADADAPTAVTHVAILDSYLIANSVGSDTFYYSNVLDPLSWDALDFATAEGKSDDINAIHVIGRELRLFGPRSIETWFNAGDATAPFQRFQGGETQDGLGAPYTVTIVDSTAFFLNNRRRFVKMVGRDTQVLSAPFDKTIQKLDSIEDAFSFRVTIGGQDFIVISFPTATRDDGSAQTGVTYVYDIRLDRWYEWASWTGSEYGSFDCTAHCYSLIDGRNYIGQKDGTIVYLDPEAYTDNGTTIRILVKSGFIDHGTLTRKQSKRIMARIKRFAEVGADVTIQFRDEYETSFTNSITATIDNTSSGDFFVDFPAMGIYRARQYQVYSTSDAPVVIGEVEEEIEVLTS